MFGRESLIGNLILGIKEHSRSFGVAGAVAGAILVIYYCGSIKHYPNGLGIADTLFFLWAVAVFGFYYSLVVFAFFVASLFWITIFGRPINYIIKKLKARSDFIVPVPKTDRFIIIVGGGIANILIYGVAYYKEHSLISIFVAIFFIGFIYASIDSVSKLKVSNELLDSRGEVFRRNPVRPEIVKIVFYVLLYIIPILFGQIGGGVARTTFETMGVRQLDVDIVIEKESYQRVFQQYQKNGFVSSVLCEDVCVLEGADILFTSIGNNTKINLRAENGIMNLVIPTKNIVMISRYESIKPARSLDEADVD